MSRFIQFYILNMFSLLHFNSTSIKFFQKELFSSIVYDCATPGTAAHQATLSLTISWSLLRLMFTESMMPSNHLILCHPFLLFCLQSFPASGSFPMSRFFTLGGQSTGVSVLTSVLSINIQDLFPHSENTIINNELGRSSQC